MKIPPLEIPTSRPDVRLREFTTRADDKALFELTQNNSEFWETFASDVVAQNQYLSWVTESRMDGNDGGEHQFGIYASDTLVGWTTVTDYRGYPDVGFWCGIWLDQLNTGNGYATAALGALASHVRASEPEIPWLSTSIHEQNLASRALFERVGFTTGHDPLPFQDDDHIAYKVPPTSQLKDILN